jgi:alkylation response protein AidB-like acyl-CoA dehydrogenase
MAIDYAKIRKQFGKIIGSFQAVKHKCAEMAVALDGARSAIYYAAWALSESQVNAPLAVSLAKAYCSDASRMICNESLQLHGGMGFTWDCDLHLYLKRAKVHESAYGNAAWHRERIARRILSQKRAEAEPVGESVMPMLAVSMR